ncbi:hypothetical protein [Hymenobacter psychrotolerans]|uniref:Uncharacterized protein n=1 Tax=Hymenobacter psychrotolerans DSM 18569 TaxID=1121959 RepID=A0A1M7GKB9_9BACT|nr:hypothetical protein [Hymenobacter psychrotolerans]SHM16616.1 hypothetical protein SAMN02746009_04054 [Hymenobacter psychrotolerans DSM 18569]
MKTPGTTSPTQPQPWIRSAAFDGLWILGPPFLALLVVALVPPVFRSSSRMPVWAWVALVVLIDVAHVYSTLFRTYFDPVRRRRFRTLLWLVPLGCYVAGVALHWAGGLWFWRVLAYAAVFHFVRQQYGFLRLYSRQEKASAGSRQLDAVLIYAATLYPLLWWHLSSPRNFNWFVAGDFVQYDWPMGRAVLTGLYGALLGAYCLKEFRLWRRSGRFNQPRNLLLLGTALSWYGGIVLFNGDLAFTLLNVVAHGIPYLALVWATSQPAAPAHKTARHWWHGRYGVALFLGLLFGLAYLEEGIWDGLVWREHAGVFGFFQQLPSVSDSLGLALLVPLLALPQATHYVLDGFIWRRGA